MSAPRKHPGAYVGNNVQYAGGNAGGGGPTSGVGGIYATLLASGTFVANASSFVVTYDALVGTGLVFVVNMGRGDSIQPALLSVTGMTSFLSSGYDVAGNERHSMAGYRARELVGGVGLTKTVTFDAVQGASACSPWALIGFSSLRVDTTGVGAANMVAAAANGANNTGTLNMTAFAQTKYRGLVTLSYDSSAATATIAEQGWVILSNVAGQTGLVTSGIAVALGPSNDNSVVIAGVTVTVANIQGFPLATL